ncbi:MAG: hypothetical protein EBS91_10965 [Betaproteobacteria bacterium]|nr:hypothetical protein [Betaproteobacteria bacterium]
MTDHEAKALARKWEALIANMRSAQSLPDLDGLLRRARSDRQMPRQVLQHIEQVTYAETRAALRPQPPPSRPTRKDMAAGETA